MRVVVAPDSFGTTMTAAEAATAFAAGWHEVAPHDELDLVPLSDGGPGLLAALEATLPDALPVAVECSGPTGQPISGTVLRAGPTAYVESALACGLAALEAARGDVGRATTYGVGQLLAAAARLAGVATVVVGLGGSGTNDGGAGMWAALGAEPADVLRGGGTGLADLHRLVAPPAPAVRLVVATDVDNPLLGATGASRVFGPQKGADEDAVRELERGLVRWADLVAEVHGPGFAERPGAGAAGGLGFGLLALGAERVSGIELVMREAGLAARVERADLVVTGEGRFDATSLRGKVPAGVARVAAAAGVPCVVAAGQAEVGRREAAAHGVEEVWSVAAMLGSVDAALAAGAAGFRALANDVARAWSG
jgi:glycerate 2-kinase